MNNTTAPTTGTVISVFANSDISSSVKNSTIPYAQSAIIPKIRMIHPDLRSRRLYTPSRNRSHASMGKSSPVNAAAVPAARLFITAYSRRHAGHAARCASMRWRSSALSSPSRYPEISTSKSLHSGFMADRRVSRVAPGAAERRARDVAPCLHILYTPDPPGIFATCPSGNALSGADGTAAAMTSGASFSNSLRKCCRAAWSRDITVPVGIFSHWAISA